MRTTALGLLAVLGLLAACAHAKGPAAGRHTVAHRTPAPSATPSLPPRSIVYFAVPVAGTSEVVVATSVAIDGSRTRLLASTDDGRTFRDIGPRLPADTYPDSAFFLDPEHGWFATFSGGGGRETLYRTADGGRTWASSAAPVHDGAAGATDDLDFVDPRDGWLADLQPTGNSAALYRTRDGGATWRLVARQFPPYGAASLPRSGDVEFETSGRGWLGGEFPYRAPLERTSDGGRTWTQVPLGGTDDYAGLPTIFGRMLVEPVIRCTAGDTELITFASTDGGLRWSAGAAARVVPGCQPVSVSFAAPDAGWAAAAGQRRLIVLRSVRDGQHWTDVAPPVLDPGGYPPAILALDANRAWLLVTPRGGQGYRVYVTSDAGRTWQRIDQRITT